MGPSCLSNQNSKTVKRSAVTCLLRLKSNKWQAHKRNPWRSVPKNETSPPLSEPTRINLIEECKPNPPLGHRLPDVYSGLRKCNQGALERFDYMEVVLKPYARSPATGHWRAARAARVAGCSTSNSLSPHPPPPPRPELSMLGATPGQSET